MCVQWSHAAEQLVAKSGCLAHLGSIRVGAAHIAATHVTEWRPTHGNHTTASQEGSATCIHRC